MVAGVTLGKLAPGLTASLSKLEFGEGSQVNVPIVGSKPAGYVHPLAIQAMAEIGIDISGHRSKHLDEFLSQPVRTVITVCGKADQACPVFPGLEPASNPMFMRVKRMRPPK